MMKSAWTLFANLCLVAIILPRYAVLAHKGPNARDLSIADGHGVSETKYEITSANEDASVPKPNHKFNPGDTIEMWACKIGPHSSPSETYDYFQALAWCKPDTLEYKDHFGAGFAGDRIVKTLIDIPFRTIRIDETICDKHLSPAEVIAFRDAILKRYSYELLYDDLPIRLFVGEYSYSDISRTAGGIFHGGDNSPLNQVSLGKSKEPVVYLYRHIDFTLSYNGFNVIEMAGAPSDLVEIKAEHTSTKGLDIKFTYSAKWESTDDPFSRRMDKYLPETHEKELEIHWFALTNSILGILLLSSALSAMMIQVVRRDFRRYQAKSVRALDREIGLVDDLDIAEDEQGWKMIRGDVFRPPPLLSRFTSCVGVGIQFFVLSVIIVCLGIFEVFHPLKRGVLAVSTIVIYSVTAFISGFVSGYLFKQLGGVKWIENSMSTVFIFSGPLCVVWMMLNTMALAFGSTSALPALNVFIVFVVWALITIPLTLLGSILGRSQARIPKPLHELNRVPRQIPHVIWYRSPITLFAVSGLAPFSCILIEVHSAMSSIWTYKTYALYEILILVFLVLIVVVSLCTVAAVYQQINAEDYRWWWGSLFYGGSVGVYFFLYAIYYYLNGHMDGSILQISFFFGYMAISAYALFLMCGSVGFLSSRLFVLFIFNVVKGD